MYTIMIKRIVLLLSAFLPVMPLFAQQALWGAPERVSPEIHPDLMNTMVEWSDFVGAARMDGDSRELVLNETGQLLAKNRYGIASILPLDWNCLMNAMSNQKPQVTGDTING